MYTPTAPIVLASSSPRRKQMLTELGIPFTVAVSNIDETQLPNETPEALVQRLALTKAETIAALHPQSWVIGADTDVSLNGKIFGKPANFEESVAMISELQNTTHEVWGGFAVVNLAKRVATVHRDCTRVTMTAIPPETCAAYAATKEQIDKAGGYAAQGIGAHFIKSIDGAFSTVVGLNICSLVAVLREIGAITLSQPTR